MKKELQESDLHLMNLPRRFWDSSLKYVTEVNNTKGIIERYTRLLPQFVKAGVGLMLWGANGRGKTSIMAVIGKEAKRNGLSVFFYESASLKADVINKVMFSETSSVWDRAKNVDILLLDDLGKGVQDSTGFGARLIDELLRYRYSRMKVTIITTNMPPSSVKDELKISTIHTMKESIIPMSVEGVDFREAKKDKIVKMLKGQK